MGLQEVGALCNITVILEGFCYRGGWIAAACGLAMTGGGGLHSTSCVVIARRERSDRRGNLMAVASCNRFPEIATACGLAMTSLDSAALWGYNGDTIIIRSCSHGGKQK